MARKLAAEIVQSKPFPSLEEEVFLNILRTADRLAADLAQRLRAAGLSLSQYNVLRILRGAGEAGLSCREISRRMVTRDPDMTRLLDGLARGRLVKRLRDRGDRRVVTSVLTEAGRKQVAGLDRPVSELLQRQLRHMSPAQLRELNRLLERCRKPES